MVMPFSGSDDVAALGAAELIAAFDRRRLSCVEACDAAIARIERLDGVLNAMPVRDFERARAEAAHCDARRAAGQRLPLLGVPMSVKECVDVLGLPTTWGVPQLQDFRPREDALAVAALKAAGAVILGKTNVPTALAGWQCGNQLHGVTRHPLDPDRTPGGSSGGSAAALAAGYVPLELGTDLAGSLRVPASFCGVFSHKPTYGLVPTRGCEFPGNDGEPAEPYVTGPMARSAADLDLTLSVIAVRDADSHAGWAAAPSLPAPRPGTLRGARFLSLDALPDVQADASVRQAMRALCDSLAQAGSIVHHRSDRLPDLAAAHAGYLRMVTTIVTRSMSDPPDALSAHEWLRLLDQRARLRRRWQRFFTEFDAVLLPAFSTVAMSLSDTPHDEIATLPVDGIATSYRQQMAWAGVASFPGLPATVAPIAADRDGYPIGVQVIGAAGQDRSTIAIAGELHALMAPRPSTGHRPRANRSGASDNDAR